MERQPTGTALSPATRISIEHVVAAAKKVQAMDVTQKTSLADEIFAKQPNLLASCLVQPRLGVDPQSVDFLLSPIGVMKPGMIGLMQPHLGGRKRHPRGLKNGQVLRC